jgi:hypothetical protein
LKKVLTREELYHLVWQHRLVDLAKPWGISDATLRKRCQEKHIPLPPAGYWVKRKNGKTFVIPELSPRAPGMDDRVMPWANRYDTGYAPWTDEELLGPIPDPPIFPEPIDAIRQRYLRIVAKVEVPSAFEHPHHAIRKLIVADAERRRLQSQRGYLSEWDGPRFSSPFEQRRLKLLNAFMLVCARIGAPVSLNDQWARTAIVTVNDQTLALQLDSAENLKGFDRYRITKTSPDEPLIVRIKAPHWSQAEPLQQWSGTDAKLEKKVRQISAEIVVEAEALYRSSCERRHAWRIEAKASRIEAIRLANEKAEQEERDRQELLRRQRIEHLLSLADEHHKAQTIRALVRSAMAESEDRNTHLAWEKWALSVAAELDPVISGRVWNHGL